MNRNKANRQATSRSSADWSTMDIDDRDLRIEIFSLCDGATEQNGRLSLVGTFETLTVLTLPFVIPQLTVVLRLRFWPDEPRQHVIRLELIGPDGRAVSQPMDGQLTLQPVDEERSGGYNLIINLQNVRMEEAGEYTVDFHLNKQMEGRLPVCVVAGNILSAGL